MLEIVHDLAPGATLAFATAFIGSASFAANIVDLKNVGCNIIVDDVTYFDESPFQDRHGRRRRQQVTAAGVLYFSSAAQFRQPRRRHGGHVGRQLHAERHDSRPARRHGRAQLRRRRSVDRVHDRQRQSDHAPLERPVRRVGERLRPLRPGLGADTIVDSSTNVQNGNDDPFEIMGSVSYAAGDRIVVLQHSGAANRMINLATNRGRLTFNHRRQRQGHNGGANTVSVSATPAAGAFGGPPNPTGPYPSPFSATNLSELFSSDGPRRMFFDFAGNCLPGAPAGDFTASGGIVLQKPDITAADGVMTAAPGFNPFYGTSAAAPHAAAIAALVKHAFPAMTDGADQVRDDGVRDRHRGGGLGPRHRRRHRDGVRNAAGAGRDPRRRHFGRHRHADAGRRQRRRVRRSGRRLEIRHHAQQHRRGGGLRHRRDARERHARRRRDVGPGQLSEHRRRRQRAESGTRRLSASA